MLTYLDHNATSPVRPEVRETMIRALDEVGNPSSVHGAGRRARKALEQAREAVAASVGAGAGEVVFTSGGTEANALALNGLPGPKIVSSIEHDSVLAAAPDAIPAPVAADGTVDLTELARLVDTHRPALVSVMLANNETGVIQPLGEVVTIARAAGALVHCDAVQGLGKVALDFHALGVNLLTLSAHKLGGPMGVGALLVREGLEIEALIRGGGQEGRRRAGTENLPGILGFARACQLLDRSESERVRDLRDRLEAGLQAIAPEARIIGQQAPRLPNTCCIALPGVARETQLIALDLAGICVSTGSACSSGKVGPSHVLAAMGLPAEVADATIRVSLGWSSTAADVERFLEVWQKLHARRQRRPTAAVA